jgi:hypothetical protein
VTGADLTQLEWPSIIGIIAIAYRIVLRRASRAAEAPGSLEARIRITVAISLYLSLGLVCLVIGALASINEAQAVISGAGRVLLAALVVALFLPVVFFFSLFFFFDHFFRWRYQCTPEKIDPPVSELIDTLSQSMGIRKPALLVSETLAAPRTFSRLKSTPQLALPRRNVSLTPPAVFIHELAHIKNGDATFVAWTEALSWFLKYWILAVLGIEGLVVVNYLVQGPIEPDFLATGIGGLSSLMWLLIVCWMGIVLVNLSVARERETAADLAVVNHLGRDKAILEITRAQVDQHFQGSSREKESRPALRMSISRWPLLRKTSLQSLLLDHPSLEARRRAIEVSGQGSNGPSKGTIRWVGVSSSIWLLVSLFAFGPVFLLLTRTSNQPLVSFAIDVGFSALLFGAPLISITLPFAVSAKSNLKAFGPRDWFWPYIKGFFSAYLYSALFVTLIFAPVVWDVGVVLTLSLGILPLLYLISVFAWLLTIMHPALSMDR